MTNLVIFDVDGTLCDTSSVDGECYSRAVGEALAADLGLVDWSAAPQVTDSGILNWLWHRYRGCAPGADEVSAVVDRFLSLLKAAHTSSPERFASVSGALDLLAAWESYPLHFVAATGGWRASAQMKLRAAGISTSLLVASCDESADRTEVFRLAAERSGANEIGDSPVLVGDGLWDIEVARRLGWRFVGMDTCGSGNRLRLAGARVVLHDFTDIVAVDRAINLSTTLVVARQDELANKPMQTDRPSAGR